MLARFDMNGEVTLGHLVGGGRFQDLFKGRTYTGVTVALYMTRFRIISKDKIEGNVVRNPFQQEIRIWSSLKHDNVLPFLGYAFSDVEAPLLISEWMENGNAMSYVKENSDANLPHIVSE